MVGDGPDGAKVKLWRERFRRYAVFPGTVEAFCRGEGVSVPTFYLWRKKLDGTAGKRQTGQQRAFRPLLVASGMPGLSVQLPGGARLEVPGENLEVVRVVVGALVHARDAQGDGDGPC
jgi:hypothetical protein